MCEGALSVSMGVRYANTKACEKLVFLMYANVCENGISVPAQRSLSSLHLSFIIICVSLRSTLYCVLEIIKHKVRLMAGN